MQYIVLVEKLECRQNGINFISLLEIRKVRCLS